MSHGEERRADYGTIDQAAQRGLEMSMSEYLFWSSRYCKCEALDTCGWEDRLWPDLAENGRQHD
jgi:hypothetical protein